MQVPVGGDPGVVHAHVAGHRGCHLFRHQLACLQAGLCTFIQVCICSPALLHPSTIVKTLRYFNNFTSSVLLPLVCANWFVCCNFSNDGSLGNVKPVQQS